MDTKYQQLFQKHFNRLHYEYLYTIYGPPPPSQPTIPLIQESCTYTCTEGFQANSNTAAPVRFTIPSSSQNQIKCPIRNTYHLHAPPPTTIIHSTVSSAPSISLKHPTSHYLTLILNPNPNLNPIINTLNANASSKTLTPNPISP